MKKLLLAVIVLALSACASYSGRGLVPGSATVEDVQRTMGAPAMRWQDADGSVQLSYPRGPASPESFMVRIGPDGRLQSIRNVLEPDTVAKIKPGLTREEVLRLIGPPEPSWTMVFPARNELAWDWRYLENGQLAHFIVLLDNTTGIVRSSMTLVDPVVVVDR